ncbi:class I SAM-dependent methyltransferase [Methylomonas koyamae]|uniref:Uncharacterized protein n=1 Tax=Methylomonas koyamae TaxID=702114 RepID=A0A291IJR7_9GAMM|nr:class I SAM-dependent methyltransferase [Methylomonas koyamae]ATG90446.1 SAM-dependent methyltransferase [Methylomonas koyamae]OAI21489.1 hypothetical protein A1356_20740 [Methylomonas koyamae]
MINNIDPGNINNEFDDTKSTGERLLTGYYDKFSLEHLHRYGLAIKLANKVEVLDIACGEGYGSNLLASVATKVYAVDIDKDTIERALKKYKAPNIDFITGSASQIPIPTASVDLVVSFETLEHHDRHEEMYAEIKRVLRPNGILIISTPDKHFFSDITEHRNAYHVKELYFDEFESLNNRYFLNTLMFSQKLHYGSLIIPHSTSNGCFSILSGDHSKIQLCNSISEPTYHICIASDNQIADLGFSIFDGIEIIDSMEIKISEQSLALSKLESNFCALKKVKDDLEKSLAYRLGSLILWPFKLFIRA